MKVRLVAKSLKPASTKNANITNAVKQITIRIQTIMPIQLNLAKGKKIMLQR